MPLPPPSDREPIHQRVVQCHGYRRDDGLWDIEGYLRDTKSYTFTNHDRGDITPGAPIHEMWLRLTIDDEFLIHAAEATLDYGPYNICPRIAPNFKRLQGLRITPGWRRQANQLVGGVNGCTHLRELLGPIATTAFQTIYPILSRERRSAGTRQKPPLLGTCHAYAPDSEVVRRLWPEYYNND